MPTNTLTQQEKLQRLLENPRFPDGRSACRLAAELGVDCYAPSLATYLTSVNARPFLMANGRRGWTLRPATERSIIAHAADPPYGGGPTLSSPGFFAGRRIED